LENLGVHTYITLTYLVVCITTDSIVHVFSYEMVLHGVNFEINEAVLNNCLVMCLKYKKLLMLWPNIWYRPEPCASICLCHNIFS